MEEVGVPDQHVPFPGAEVFRLETIILNQLCDERFVFLLICLIT